MEIITLLIVVSIVTIIVNVIMSFTYKGVEKKDKGFVLNYHKLTYRRRLLRSLWGVPFISLLYLAIYWIVDLTSNELKILGILFFLLVLSEIFFNYIKWKKNEKTE